MSAIALKQVFLHSYRLTSKVVIKFPPELAKLGIDLISFSPSGDLRHDHDLVIRESIFRKLALAIGKGSSKIMDILLVPSSARTSLKKPTQWAEYLAELFPRSPPLQYIVAFACEQVRNVYTHHVVRCDACGRWRRIWKDAVGAYQASLQGTPRGRWTCDMHPDGDLDCSSIQECFILPPTFYRNLRETAPEPRDDRPAKQCQ